MLFLLLAGCATQIVPPEPPTPPPPVRFDAAARNDIVFAALGLIDTHYQFGGLNPEAGIDCSGLVVLVWERVFGRKLPHNAAAQAKIARPLDGEPQSGDLVFFNTLGRPRSHVGIYVGDGRFIHAPSSRGKVRIDRLDSRYFSERYEDTRSLFE